MSYQITYESDTVPTDLPAGASVEWISVLPLRLKTDLSRTIEVDGRPGGALLTVRETGYDKNAVCAALSTENTRMIAHALLEAIDEAPAEPGAKPAGRLLSEGVRVRLVVELPYVGVGLGSVGTIEGEIDFDDEYWVRFEDTSEYVHYSKLALA